VTTSPPPAKGRRTLEPEPSVKTYDGSMVVPFVDRQPVVTHPVMSAVISTDTSSSPPPVAQSGKLQNTVNEFQTTQPVALVLENSAPTRPVVRDFTDAVVQEAQKGDVAAENLLRACEGGAVGSGDVPIPPVPVCQAPANISQTAPRPATARESALLQEMTKSLQKAAAAFEATRSSSGWPPAGGPKPQPAPQVAASFRNPKPTPACEKWLQEPVDVEGSPC
jgi:hypothetical protein